MEKFCRNFDRTPSLNWTNNQLKRKIFIPSINYKLRDNATYIKYEVINNPFKRLIIISIHEQIYPMYPNLNIIRT